MPLSWFQSGAGLVLPWLMVLAFVLVGIGVDRYLPKPAFLSKPLRAIQLRAFQMKPGWRAGLLGLATPLLPCGPLYVMLGLAMVNGSAMRGAEFAGAFALGTLRSGMGRARYVEAVGRGLGCIRAGDVYQVNLAHHLRGAFEGSPRALARELFRSASPRYGAYLEHLLPDGSTRAIVSLSPELFIAYDAQTRRVVTRPMKGTRPASSGGEGAEKGASAAPAAAVAGATLPAFASVSAWGARPAASTASR
jgi:hypothetical protein